MNHNTPNRKLSSVFTPLASSSISKSSLRLDLDFSSLNSGRRNSNTKLDFTYNEYLQALAKKRIISTTIKNYEELLKQQICYQNQVISKMKKECGKKKQLLENTNKENESIKILHKLEDNFQRSLAFSECANIDQLTSLSNILETALAELKLVAVKRFSDKEECFSLVKVMNEFCKFLQYFFQSHKGFKEFEMIDEITLRFKEVLELQTNIQEQIEICSSINKNLSVKYLENIKLLFEVLEREAI